MIYTLHACQKVLRQFHQYYGDDFLIRVKANNAELEACAKALLLGGMPAVIRPTLRNQSATSSPRYRRKRR